MPHSVGGSLHPEVNKAHTSPCPRSIAITFGGAREYPSTYNAKYCALGKSLAVTRRDQNKVGHEFYERW